MNTTRKGAIASLFYILIVHTLYANRAADETRKTVKAIEKGVKKTYKTVVKPISTFAQETEERLAACAATVGLGTEWAAAQAALQSAQLALDTARTSAHGLGFITQQIGKVGGQAINIQEASFELDAHEMAQGKLITLHVQGIFFGKPLALDVPFDIHDSNAAIERFFAEIMSKIKTLSEN